MKFKIVIDKSREEEVIVYAHAETKLTDEIERLVSENSFELIGYKNKNAVKFSLNEVNCFSVEGGKVYAFTEEKLLLKSRLYKIEENLSESFIKINQSTIANVRMIKKFDASLGGSLRVIFKNGYSDYVSRRQLKKVKERLGL